MYRLMIILPTKYIAWYVRRKFVVQTVALARRLPGGCPPVYPGRD